MQASDAWVLLTVWVLLTMKVLQFQYYRTACTEHSGHQLVPVIAGLPCTLVTASVPHCLHPSLPLHRLKASGQVCGEGSILSGECEQCPSGSYSLGGAIELSNWTAFSATDNKNQKISMNE